MAKMNASVHIPAVSMIPAKGQCCILKSAPNNTTDAPRPMIRFLRYLPWLVSKNSAIGFIFSDFSFLDYKNGFLLVICSLFVIHYYLIARLLLSAGTTSVYTQRNPIY